MGPRENASESQEKSNSQAGQAQYQLNVKSGRSLQPLRRPAHFQLQHPTLDESRNLCTLESRTSLIHDYLGRSKSANSSIVHNGVDPYATATLTRVGPITPAYAYKTLNQTHQGAPHSDHRSENIRIRCNNQMDSRSAQSNRSQRRARGMKSPASLSPSKMMENNLEHPGQESAHPDGASVMSQRT